MTAPTSGPLEDWESTLLRGPFTAEDLPEPMRTSFGLIVVEFARALGADNPVRVAGPVFAKYVYQIQTFEASRSLVADLRAAVAAETTDAGAVT